MLRSGTDKRGRRFCCEKNGNLVRNSFLTGEKLSVKVARSVSATFLSDIDNEMFSIYENIRQSLKLQDGSPIYAGRRE